MNEKENLLLNTVIGDLSKAVSRDKNLLKNPQQLRATAAQIYAQRFREVSQSANWGNIEVDGGRIIEQAIRQVQQNYQNNQNRVSQQRPQQQAQQQQQNPQQRPQQLPQAWQSPQTQSGRGQRPPQSHLPTSAATAMAYAPQGLSPARPSAAKPILAPDRVVAQQPVGAEELPATTPAAQTPGGVQPQPSGSGTVLFIQQNPFGDSLGNFTPQDLSSMSGTTPARAAIPNAAQAASTTAPNASDNAATSVPAASPVSTTEGLVQPDLNPRLSQPPVPYNPIEALQQIMQTGYRTWLGKIFQEAAFNLGDGQFLPIRSRTGAPLILRSDGNIYEPMIVNGQYSERVLGAFDQLRQRPEYQNALGRLLGTQQQQQPLLPQQPQQQQSQQGQQNSFFGLDPQMFMLLMMMMAMMNQSGGRGGGGGYPNTVSVGYW